MSNQMARAADIINTMATPGWNEIMKEMLAVLNEFNQELFECEDDSKVLRLQHQASAAEKFYKRWQKRVDAAANIQPEVDFQPVAY